MLKAFINLFKIPDTRKKVLFTLAILAVFRIGSQIPVPGIDLVRLLDIRGNGGQGGLADFLNLFTGGARDNASVFSLGVMPYITASIIMTLLKAVVPSIDQMVKEGPEGHKKFQQYTRYLTVAVTIIQGFIFGQSLLAESSRAGFITISSTLFLVIFTFAVTAGTLVLMWMGEQITERGIGNGVSLIIMVGIVARLPHALFSLFIGLDKGTTDPMNLIIMIAVFVLIIGVVVFEELALRKIPIQYANRSTSQSSHGMQVSFLPYKLNPAGVIPIIFASSLLIIPAQLSDWAGGKVEILRIISQNIMPSGNWYSLVYFILIIFFAFFYTEVYNNPHDTAEHLRKSGAFIPGVRPGPKTEEFIQYTLSRITLPGSLFLGLIALVPTFVIDLLRLPKGLGYLMGGTSLLIMVGVSIDTLKQIESHLIMHNMEGFFLKGNKKS